MQDERLVLEQELTNIREQIARLEPAARHAVIVRAGNMSLGVNLLVQLTRRVAAALDAEWDIEVVEAHHKHKVDAPSGTALMLGEAAAEGRGVQLDRVADRGRDGMGKRRPGDIGFHAIRGGDVVGDHTVLYCGEGERVELSHRLSTARVLQIVRRAAGQRRHELFGDGHGDVEVRDPRGVVLASDELPDIRMIHAQHGHIRAPSGATLADDT